MNNQPPEIEKKPRDLDSYKHRQLIGWLGIMLPVLVVGISRLWPVKGMPWKMLNSVSAFYYTSATAVFIGTLFALAMFLFAYGGYEGDRIDQIMGKIACFAALGVALFPTTPPTNFIAPPWWSKWMATAHHISAASLFISFSIFAFIFLRTSVKEKKLIPKEKRVRNRIFFVCGCVIIMSIIVAFVAAKFDKSIFWPETIAIVAFAISWLLKGRVHESARNMYRKVRGLIVKQPE